MINFLFGFLLHLQTKLIEMRNLLYILLTTCLLVSCSSNNDSTVNTSIIGRWNFGYSTPYQVGSNNVYANQTIDSHIRNRAPEYISFIFTVGGKIRVIRDIDREEIDGAYTIEGNKLTINYTDFDNVSKTLVYEFVVHDNIFVLKRDDTDFYAREIPYLLPEIRDVLVSKVLVEVTYIRDLGANVN